MKLADVQSFASIHRKKVGWAILATALFYGLFLFRMSSMMPQFAPVEVATHISATSLRALWDNPVNAPYKLLVWLPNKFITESLQVTRIAASIFGAVTIWLFFLLLKQRYSLRQAVFGTAIFATSSAFLHASRLGAPYILQTIMLLPFLLPLLWYHPKVPRNLVAYIMIALFAVGLYVPGFVWFVLAAFIIYRRHLFRVISATSNKHLAIAGVFSLVLMAPIIWSSAHDLGVLRELLGFGPQLPSLGEFASALARNIEALVWKSQLGADVSLVGAPFLSAVDGILALFGAYHLWSQKPRLASTFYISGIVVLAVLLASLGGSVQLIMAVPFIYLFVAAGIYYLLNEWLKVFPRNPVAKRSAVAVILVLVGISCIFHLRAYYVAWPHNQQTKQLFVQPQPPAKRT